MKILKIIIKNIHSLAGEHVIDFTQPPLSDSGIFAITGPTGSGKSTILDAISLALYGNISRFNTSKTSIIKNQGAIVTRGKSQAKAEVLYEANGQVYHSIWLFAGKKIEMQLLDHEQNIIAQKTKEVIDKNTEIIGLNYHQFIRAVILPQGQFDKFLKADSDERIRILEQLTGTEIYRLLSQKAFEITKQKRIELETLQQRLQDIKLLTKDQIADIHEQIGFLEEIDTFLNKKAKHVQNQIQIKQQISDLEQKLQDLNKKLGQLNEQKQLLEPELKKLDLHKKILPHAPKIEKYNNLRKQTYDLQKQIQLLENKTNTLKQQLETQQLHEKELKKQLTNLQDFIANAQPLLQQLQNIEKQINTINELTQNKQKDQKNIQSKLITLTNKIQQINRQILELESRYKQISQWLTQNQTLEQLQSDLKIFENTAQIYTKTYNELKNSLNQSHFKELKLQLPLDQPAQALKTIDYLIHELTARLNAQKQKLSTVTDKNALLNQQKLINSQLQALSKIQGLSSSMENLKNLIQQLNNQVQSLQQLKNKQQARLNDQKKLIKVLENKLKIAEIELENQRIANSSTYIRQKLNDGDSCPVCGNTYHKHSAPELHQIDLKQYQDKVEQQRKQLEQANLQLTKINTELQNINSQISDKQNQIQNYNQQLQQLQNQIKIILTKHNIHLESFDNQTITQKINELQQNNEKINQQISLLDQIQQMQQNLTNLANLKQQLNQLTEIKQNLNSFKQKYQDYLNKITNLKAALTKLRQLHEQWQNFTNEKQQIEKQLLQLKSAVKSLTEQKNDITSELQNIKKQIQINRDQLKTLVSNQKNIISQLNYHQILPAAQIKDDLHQKLQNLQKSIATIQQNITQLTTSLNETNLNLTQTKNQKQTLENELKTIENQLNQILTNLGFENIQQAQNALLTEQQAQETEQKNQKIQQAITATNQQISDTQNQLKKLQNSDTSHENLQTLQKLAQQLTNNLKTLQQKIGGLKEELNNNKRQQAAYNQLLNQLKQAEAELARWEQLNDLIGSADGDKFQRLVQELNLRELVNEANKHLTKLAPRYQLWYQKTAANKKLNLDLVVIDNYMGGEQRSVKTLSGGESFLVSLALALGLSSLASYKISLKNLFIDEGFGSLDSQTLDMVLSTLEKLQSDTNRQIGVISHVEALKERIPVKINLIKLSGGYSRIQVSYL